jgi:uncharacterized protein with HEPN domain
MSKRNVALLLNDILENGEKIIRYTRDLSYETFVADDKTIDAVIRNDEIIGEAANRLPDDFKETHPEIDWHRIRGFRNRIVHHYFGIDYSILWQIKETFLPKMLSAIKQLI